MSRTFQAALPLLCDCGGVIATGDQGRLSNLGISRISVKVNLVDGSAKRPSGGAVSQGSVKSFCQLPTELSRPLTRVLLPVISGRLAKFSSSCYGYLISQPSGITWKNG
jgi:hypothetical protein